ncbi:MAG: fluoride efflux transporter CrcB [Verrucomicrobiota bacterium]
MSEILKTYLCISLGGALGSMARFWISMFVDERVQGNFPWGTFLVNVIGSFVIGALAAVADQPGRFSLSPAMRQLLMVGICGGFTTFSSFSIQTLELMRGGQLLHAAANVVGSVLLCLLAVWGGHQFGQILNR